MKIVLFSYPSRLFANLCSILKNGAWFQKLLPVVGFPVFHRRFEAEQEHNKILISNHETPFMKHTHASEKEQKYTARLKPYGDRLNGNSALNHIKRLSKRSSTKPKTRYYFSFVITAPLFNIAVVVYKTI